MTNLSKSLTKYILMLKLIILLLASLTACSPVAVKTFNNPDLSLVSYETYNFMDFKYTHYDSISYNENIYQYFIQQMNNHLQVKGLKLSENPNLILNIGVAVRQEQQIRETDIRTDMNYTGQRNYQWKSEEKVVGVYDVGDLTIDFVDVEKNTLVWQASIEEMLSKKEDKMKKKIDKALDKLFSEFPDNQ